MPGRLPIFKARNVPAGPFRFLLRTISELTNLQLSSPMPIKVLNVDDSKMVHVMVGKALAPYDCELLEANNGEEGLATAAREKPGLILLDITMPIMDGKTMLARLRDDPELKAIPVVMLTAESGRENVLELAKLGVRDYLVKPFKGDQLVEKIKRIIALVLKPA